jgi:hypothetical protein
VATFDVPPLRGVCWFQLSEVPSTLFGSLLRIDGPSRLIRQAL